MKTYHEMTESVLQKAGTEIVKKERRRRNGVFIVASGLCLALLLTVLGMGLEQPPEISPTLSVEQPGLSADATDATQLTQQQSGVKLSFLREVEGQVLEESLSGGVMAPIDFVLRVRDVRGLDETAIEAAKQEEWAFAQSFREKWKGKGDGGIRTGSSERVIITQIYNGFLYLEVDYNQISSMSAETEDGSAITLVPYYYKQQSAEGEEIRRGIRIFDPVSRQMCSKLEEDPTMPLSTLRDSITVTLTYNNGSPETVIIDIMLDDEGNIYVMQRADSYGA